MGGSKWVGGKSFKSKKNKKSGGGQGENKVAKNEKLRLGLIKG